MGQRAKPSSGIAHHLMRMLPPTARAFVATTILAGALLLFGVAPSIAFRQPALFAALFFLSSLTSALKVTLPLTRSKSTMSVSYAVDFAALLLLGPHETMLIAGASAWSQCTFRRREINPIHRTLFSMAALVITVQAAGLVYGWCGGTIDPANLSAIGGPLVAAASAYFLVNSGLVATAIALSTRQSVFRIWNANFLWGAPSYYVGAGAAAAAALLITRSGYWLAALTVAPLYLTYRTYKVYLDRIDDERRHVRQLSDLHLATIEALALAIDAKDQTAHTHIRRVQTYAASLARSLGMAENDVEGVTTAALLHDIGKLAVPEHILSKPGPLTEEEFQKIRTHPQIGAEIIAHVPFPYPVAPLIRSHHERWDGRGYPLGLKGEEIPLGARVLTVADYFDALMRDRPYHKAMSFETAVGLLRQEAGKALDPHLVERFIGLLPTLLSSAERNEQEARRLQMNSEAARLSPAADDLAEPSETAAFENIALAHREIYALYEIAQAMGSSLGVPDTMALISSKLSALVPFACCALFLHDEETDQLRCGFAQGVDASLIQQIVVPNGQGLAGWVARNRRALVNARPGADLECVGMIGQTTSLKSALASPLVFNDRLIGTLHVYDVEPGRYTDDHRRLLDRVSEQAAAVISNSIVFEQTREDSLSDPLTGLPNTRYLFMFLSRELARAERHGNEVSLLVMDLDRFKEINDSHGHHVGDLALQEVASVLRSTVRSYDLCVRYAGDEFIVVLPGCNAEEAEARRVELQRAIASVHFEARPGKALQINVSIGAAVFPRDGRTYEGLLATADRRMYRDKARRRPGPRLQGSRPLFDLGVIPEADEWELAAAEGADTPATKPH